MMIVSMFALLLCSDGLARRPRAFYFLLWPVTVSTTLSKVSLILAFAWSARPSFFRRVLPLRLPAASLMRPLPLSTCLSVVVV